jgi:hypothetical protein
VPLTTKQKFAIAKDDSLDRGTVVLAALFGAEAQFFGSNPSFGHGLTAYARYTAASHADWSIGNVMTEGVFPTLLHEDPRYFRRGAGSAWSRLGYAVQQIFWTHTDSGGGHFNDSEVVGNSTPPRFPISTTRTTALSPAMPPRSACRSAWIWPQTSSRNSHPTSIARFRGNIRHPRHRSIAARERNMRQTLSVIVAE